MSITISSQSCMGGFVGIISLPRRCCFAVALRRVYVHRFPACMCMLSDRLLQWIFFVINIFI